MRQFLFFFSVLRVGFLFGDLVADPSEYSEFSYSQNEPIFISLGAACMPAKILAYGNLRKAAYPLDWITSLDNEELIQAIEEKMVAFLDEEYLVPDNYLLPNPHDNLVHMRYHFEFPHEGDFCKQDYPSSIEKMKAKYTRRIHRFNDLEFYPGTVYFLRRHYEDGISDPQRMFKSKKS